MRSLRDFASHLVTAAWMVLALGSNWALAQTKVSFGSINATSDAGVFLADAFGHFAEESIVLDFHIIGDAPALIAAVATNQLDAAGVSTTPGLFAAVQQGINLRIVGDKQSFSPGFGSTRIAVRKGAVKANEAETVKAFKGMTVAINSKGAITFYFMERLLAKHGLTLQDVNLVELSYANIATALAQNTVEAGTLIEPFLSQAIQSGAAELLSDLLEFTPGGSMSVTPLVYSEKFRANRPLGEAFMRAYIKGVRAYNDALTKGIRKEEVINIIAQRTRVDPKIVREGAPPGLDPNQRINVDAFNVIEKFYADQGLVRNVIDASPNRRHVFRGGRREGSRGV